MLIIFSHLKTWIKFSFTTPVLNFTLRMATATFQGASIYCPRLSTRSLLVMTLSSQYPLTEQFCPILQPENRSAEKLMNNHHQFWYNHYQLFFQIANLALKQLPLNLVKTLTPKQLNNLTPQTHNYKQLESL